MDVVDKKTRSRMMSGIRGKNTRPEFLIRNILFERGFRYRLHSTVLSGKPDLVFARYRAVVFVHGCFWHGHLCHLFKWPKSNAAFWKKKILGNKRVDKQVISQLHGSGWRTATVWECALKGRYRLRTDVIADRLEKWLLSKRKLIEIIGSKKR